MGDDTTFKFTTTAMATSAPSCEYDTATWNIFTSDKVDLFANMRTNLQEGLCGPAHEKLNAWVQAAHGGQKTKLGSTSKLYKGDKITCCYGAGAKIWTEKGEATSVSVGTGRYHTLYKNCDFNFHQKLCCNGFTRDNEYFCIAKDSNPQHQFMTCK